MAGGAEGMLLCVTASPSPFNLETAVDGEIGGSAQAGPYQALLEVYGRTPYTSNMPAAKPKKTERLEVRISRLHKVLIEEAAALAGQPVASFAVSTLVERAESMVREHEVTRLSARDRKLFFQALDQAEPNPVLRRAARKFKSRHG